MKLILQERNSLSASSGHKSRIRSGIIRVSPGLALTSAEGGEEFFGHLGYINLFSIRIGPQIPDIR